MKIAPVVVALAAALCGACKVDEAGFGKRVFPCDKGAPDPLCGTDGDGQPMTCFGAGQLGGADFCAPSCAEPMSLPEDGAICVQGGAKLKTCNPLDARETACGRPELGCLRTNVLQDEGVCVTMQPCSVNGDCRDNARATCATTFLKELYTGNPDLRADHLYCLQQRCIEGQANCSAGETCLRTVIPAAANPPDICVPNCDSQLRCPPNHFCYRKLSGPANPAVCIPGLLGFVCETDVDCLVGRCVDDEGAAAVGTPEAVGLRLCTIDCQKDADCATFDSAQGKFLCNEAGHCATPSAYRGASCDSQADCTRNPGTVCTWFSPDEKAAGEQGTCVYPCGDGGACPKLGGINHTCLLAPGQDPATPVCFPGFFGMPCAASDDCVGDFSCRGPDAAVAAGTTPAGICTALCAADEDCAADRWTDAAGYCGATVGGPPICLPLLADGEPCQQDSQCRARRCMTTVRDNMSVRLCGGGAPR